MKKNILLLSAFTALSLSLPAEKIYVAPDGAGDGTSWDKATSLENALSLASNGDEIFVKKGTYTAPATGFVVNSADISVYGNCEGIETEKPTYDLDNIETYLKGGGGRVLYFKTASTFSGFDISEGDASTASPSAGRAGGVYVDNANGKIEYCIVHNNCGMDESKAIGLGGVGGGLYLVGIAENCIIRNNVGGKGVTTKRAVGGGLRMEGKDCKLINCIVKGNAAVTADTKVGNGQILGGGVSATGGVIVNCLIAENATGTPNNNNQNFGGGIDLTLASNQVQIINCTVVNNTVAGQGGGIGFKETQEKHVFIKNCIVWGNQDRGDSHSIGGQNIPPLKGTVATLEYTLWAESDGTNHNLSADPMLSDNFRLQEGSPAINAGDKTAVSNYTKDLAGKNRVLNDVVDMGAYEYDGSDGGDPTAIDDIDANETPIMTQYYTLSGLPIAEPIRPGLYIVKKTYTSQKQTTQKIFIPAK